MKDKKYDTLHGLLSLMLISIAAIRGYISGIDKDTFLSNTEKQDACIMQLQVLGELCHKIEKKFPDFSAFEYKKIIRMRHIISHDYFGIDRFEVWITISQNILGLEEVIRHYLASND